MNEVEFLEHIVLSIVEDKEAVSITRSVDEMGVLLTLIVAQPDMGKIIGREGNTAKAIRTLVRVIGMKNKAHINLKIVDPINPSRPLHSTEFDREAL